MAEGASYSEQLLECARRNNTELFTEIEAHFAEKSQEFASLIDTTKEVVTGNGPLHIATMLGNWDVLDKLLDVEDVNIDALNRENATPLHLAVKYASEEPELGYFIADNLLDAGCDPRLKDAHGLKPLSYVKDDLKLLDLLNSAEYAVKLSASEIEQRQKESTQDDDPDDEESASDSD